MFYLVEFFKSIGESFLRGITFFLFSCLLAFSLTHHAWIKSLVIKVTPEKMTTPYFVAVLDGALPVEKIKHAVAKLPGVMEIKEESAQNQNKVQNLLNQLGPGYIVSSDLVDFKSIRIMLKSSLSSESLNFIREQVIKMASAGKVTATGVKYPEVTKMMKSHPFYVFVEKAGDWGIIGLISIFWIISYWLIYGVFRSRGYVIEKFQRKKLVAAKSLAAGLGCILVLFVGLGILNGTLAFLDLIALAMVFSVFWTFSMKDWKWKPTL